METGTRTDCTRDNVKVLCKGSTSFAGSMMHCKRGYWITWETDDHKHIGRVISRVRLLGALQPNELRTYIEVAALTHDCGSAYVRWIDPNAVRSIHAEPPRRVLDFITGDFKAQSAEVILYRLHQGFCDPAYLGIDP